MSASVLDGNGMTAQFVYRVPGPVRPEVAEALNDRYGPSGWFGAYLSVEGGGSLLTLQELADAKAQLIVALKIPAQFIDLSYVVQPIDATEIRRETTERRPGDSKT